ncbi:MAG TPA: hypothetical protein DCZ43_06440 [candidate division Zixibacteria bacterium]|nr:hypothetical protein [candidate division Zixibacteria bacterium]
MPDEKGLISIENMFYGALPNRRMGQEVLGKTPGITAEIEAEIVEFCNSWGDCRNLKFRRSLNQFPLDAPGSDGSDMIAVVKVVNAGRDSMGREGTLVRHALILNENDYRQIEFNPFTLEAQGAFLEAWTQACDCRPILVNSRIIPPTDLSEIPRSFFKQIKEYIETVLSGGTIFLFINNHLHTAEDVIYYVFKLLPADFRAQIALTTFAFRRNLEYQIGCYYRQSDTSPDPLKVQFEMSGEKNKVAMDFATELFDSLENEKYGQAARMLAAPFPVKK